MKYRKRGSAARWENGSVLQVRECGVASEHGDAFSCRPDDADPLPPVDPSRVTATALQIVAMIPSPLRIERLVVSEGTSEQRCSGTVWTEHHERIHLSLVKDRERVLIDLGELDPAPIGPVAAAFVRSDGVERAVPPRLRLSPAVCAAFLPSLVGLAPPNVELWQSGGGTDGIGRSVAEVRIGKEP